MQEIKFDNIAVQQIFKSAADKKKISVSILRLDLIHPVISGNKWFKLKFYIEEAKQQNKKTILTFGGAWSNHIAATACFCRKNNLKSIGIIRGEEPASWSETLKTAKEYGMKLVFMSRSNYKNKTIPELFINDEDIYIIPEGGYGVKGAEGFATALEYCEKNGFTHFACAAGTGTMMAGLIKAASVHQKIVGIPVLKNNTDLLPGVERLLTVANRNKNFKLIEGYQFGGYAKYTGELLNFMNSFYRENAVPADFVYTGKLLFGINDLITEDYFPANSKILVIHSGGLQGNSSLPPNSLIF